jgi:hypothetical protein
MISDTDKRAHNDFFNNCFPLEEGANYEDAANAFYGIVVGNKAKISFFDSLAINKKKLQAFWDVCLEKTDEDFIKNEGISQRTTVIYTVLGEKRLYTALSPYSLLRLAYQ